MRRKQWQNVVYYQFESIGAETIRHGVFTRLGGQSQPPWDELNVGHTVGDDLDHVAANHRHIYEALGVSASQVVTAHQVHGTRVETIDHVQLGDLQGGDQGAVMADTDALITDRPNVMLMLRFADCMPILFHDPVVGAIGLAHAGWRGTISNVAGATVAAMSERFGSDPSDIIAGLGPSIRACCYEVGDIVTKAAAATWSAPDVFFHRQANGALHFDLVRANRHWLAQAGVHHVEVAPFCTACHTDQFYSHRAEAGRTGRFAALIGIKS